MELAQLSLQNQKYSVDSTVDSNISTLDEWVTFCGVPYDGKTVNEQGTFVDENGVLRFVENWQSVEGYLRSKIKVNLSKTGCMDIPVATAPMSTSKNEPKEPYEVSFMMDFRKLWNHFELDGIDEVAEYSPIFRIYIETFFHRRTIQLMIFLTVYTVAVLVIVNQVYDVFDAFGQFQYCFYVAIQGIVYLALVRLFKGSVFGEPPLILSTDQSAEKHGGCSRVKRGLKLNQPSTFMYFLWEAIQTTDIELRRFLSREGDPARTASFSNKEKSLPFYAVLGIALKFLSKHNKGGSAHVRLNRRIHNAKLLFIFLVVPIYSIIQTFASPIGALYILISVCDEDGRNSDKCKNLTLICVLTLGYAVSILQKIIFMSAVLLALVGLSFGAEIGRGLVDSWIHRFGTLRRLSTVDSAELRSNTKTEESGSVFNVLHKKPAGSKAPPADEPSVPPRTASVLSMPISEIQPYLQRDAFEHYLFIKEYMSIASAAWSPTIVALTFLDAFFVLLFVSGAITVGTVLSVAVWTYCSFWIAIRVSVLSIYPVMALAHANAYVYALQEQFLVAAPEDFAVIGGRDSWLEYLDKVPAMWTIYGVNITWDRLSGLLWTTVAGLGAIAITFVSSAADS